MPFRVEHSCRQKDPKLFLKGKDDWARKSRKSKSTGKTYIVVYGRLKKDGPGSSMVEQSYRYKIETWSEAEARKHCKKHEGILFEPAKPEKKSKPTKTDFIEYESSELADLEIKDGEEGIKEKRYTQFNESRVLEDDRGKRIEAEIAVYNQYSDPILNWKEIIKAGAAKDDLTDTSILRMSFFNHNPDKVLGSSENDTAFFKDTPTGVDLTTWPPDTTDARNVITLVEGRYITRASFAFYVPKGGDRWTGTAENPVREIHTLKLREGGPVSFAQYPQTSVAVRGIYRNFGINFEATREGIAKTYLQIPLSSEEKDVLKRTSDIINLILESDLGKSEEEHKDLTDYYETLRLKMENAKVKSKN